MRKPRLVVVGGGVGGAAAVVELRKEGFDGGIKLISAEDTVPYERPPLSKEFLLGTPDGQRPGEQRQPRPVRPRQTRMRRCSRSATAN